MNCLKFGMRMLSGWPNYYVSKDGGVYSYKARKWLKPRLRKDGYVNYRLYRPGLPKGRLFLAHRLVLFVFDGPPPNGHEADHINKNRSDNRSSNLRWVTKSQNCIERDTFRFNANNHPMAKLTEKQRREIATSPARNYILATQYGISRSMVGRLKRDKRYAA